MIYLIPTILFLVLIYFYDYRGKSSGRLTWWIVMCVGLICIGGFRYKMGIDSIKYENYFTWLHPIQELNAGDFRHTRFSPLYIVLSSLCRSLTSEFMIMQFVVSTIINVTVFRFLWQNTRHVFFAAFLYWIFLFLNLNMEVLREALAVSVFLWAWPFYRSSRWLWWYVAAVVAFFFHVSSIVLFILPLLWLPGVRTLFRFGPQAIVMCLLSAGIAFAINHWFFDFVRLVAVTENMAERAVVYSRTELSGNTLNIFGALGQIVRFVLYPLLALWFLKKHREGEEPSEAWQKKELLALTGIYVAMATLGITILQRYNNYFLFFSFIVTADWAFTSFKTGVRWIQVRFIYWMFLFLPLFGFQFNSYFNNMNPSGTIRTYMMYYPYSNQFEREIAPDRARAIRYSRRL